MKLLLASEGPRDFGSGETQGIVGVLVRRLLSEKFRRDVSPAEIVPVPLQRAHKHSSSTSGYPRKVELAIIEAAARGFTSVVVVVDRDGPRNVARIQDLQAGLELAQGNGLAGVAGMSQRTAVGVAIETAEAWLLADSRALNQALGAKVPTPPDPESMWGEQQHPKTFLGALISATDREHGATLDAIAELVDLGLLERRCRVGFGALADQIRKACG